MLSFRLNTINKAEITDDVLAAWELAAFFMEISAPEELPLDEDGAVEWYIENIVDDNSRSDYRAESQMAADEMIEFFSNSLRSMVKIRAKHIGEHYPFYLNDVGQLVRKPLIEITLVGASYLSLQFFRALNGKTIEIEGVNDAQIQIDRTKFDVIFRKMFEYIAGYTVAGIQAGASFMTSDCRSSLRLNQLLNRLCAKVGAGVVLPYESWNDHQKNANDGGVDCLVHVGGPAMPGNAHFVIVGATVQKSNIDAKIMGSDKLDFFSRFFTAKPAAFFGALVRPQDEDELTKLKCASKDCLLFSYRQIWMGMGQRTAGAYQSNKLSRMDVGTRSLFKNYQEIVFLHEYEEYKVAVLN